MRPSTLFLAALASNQALAAPSLSLSRRLFDTISPVEDIILFDSPAFQDPSKPSNWIATFRAYVFLRQINLSIIATKIKDYLEDAGVDVGDNLHTLEARARLFGAIGMPSKEVTVKIDACNGGKEVVFGETALSDLGLLEKNVPLGSCGAGAAGKKFMAKVDFMSLDKREVNGSVFPSLPTGYGIISDIDDTIKISHVLETTKALSTIFLEQPKPVPTFPELYASLKTRLSDPQYIYLSGSPFQLYPTLKEFVATHYVPGPILLQNLTFVDIPGLVNFIKGATREYKTDGIVKINKWYPKKKWVAIGDSGQADPEVYGDAYRKHGGDWLQCIWIRKVEGGNNTQARFAKAFEGVPPARYKIVDDAKSLMNVDVAGGKCQ